jgi:hypothetical protein
VGEVLRSAGQPLDPKTRTFFESRFGHDFGSVRVHTDAKAVDSAQAVNAFAYTVGSHIVFAPAQYQPETTSGRQLLAHELTHVTQQNGVTDLGAKHIPIDPSAEAERQAHSAAAGIFGSALRSIGTGMQRTPVSLQRDKDDCHGAGATCADEKTCGLPDSGTQANSASTTWMLTVNIDVEASDFESALRSSRVGHTYVTLSENNGNRYTYGFYPSGAVPNENRRSVPGCVHHPDTTHEQCIDDRVVYSLGKTQYEAALATAKKICSEGHTYGASYTCTTFADEVVRAAGQTLPSSKSEPMTIFYQAIPPIDNPNTLYERVQEERKKDKYRRSPFWNNPCFNQCEAEFDECIQRSSGSPGLFGFGGVSVLQPQRCLVARNLCNQKCAKLQQGT